MDRRQGIVLSSVLLLFGAANVFAECRGTKRDVSQSVPFEALLVPSVAEEKTVSITCPPRRSPDRSLTQRPVMLMAGVGIALGLLIRTVKLRSV